jgi:ATP-binding cassette subfamily B protein
MDLKIQPGWTVALVGQTGCGKSTIINLLYRFYDVCGGSLMVDGKDIREYDTQFYRRNLAIVPQEPIILDDTIAGNIAYGRPTASHAEIMRAAQMAELEEVVKRYPEGLDTLLGERGIRLSVGEKQRICIARAILADPAILVLDEATSSLDTKSETMIQSAMRKVMAGRTNFVVAHRLSTIVDADLIVVLEDGRITEMGNHKQLLNRPDGKYHKLYMTQLATSPYIAV